MITTFYMPILKPKQGEFQGLFLLNTSFQGYVVPLVEVTNIEFDNEENEQPKSIEDHLNRVAKRVMTKWGRSNAFIDTHLVNATLPSGMNPVTYLYARLEKGVSLPSLVVRLVTPEAIRTAIKEVMKTYGLKEVAIRMTITDLVASDLPMKTQKLLDDLNLSPECSHLVLDLADSDFTNTDDFSDAILERLKVFPNFHSWKSFTTCGGSFPKTNILKSGPNVIARGEWRFFNNLTSKLQKEEFARHVNYGDYGILAPGHFQFDPIKMDRSANIRYTHDDIWFAMKGSSIKLNGNEQYYDLANQIVESGYFLNEHFSAGDALLMKCALHQTKTAGNATVWNKIGFNHHFEKVIYDLRASYLAA